MPHYCPDYRSTDLFKGNYYTHTHKYYWLRLAVHRCDPHEMIEDEEEKMKNKKCASREE